MSQKKQSEELYRIIKSEGTHLAVSKKTDGALRALEFEDGTNKLVGPAELIRVEEKRQSPKTYNELNPMGQLLIDMAEIIVPRVTEYLTDKAITSFDRWWQNRGKQNKKKKPENILTRKSKAQQILESRQSNSTEITPSKENTTAMPFMEFDNAFKEYSINMTSEEVQKELIDIFMLSAIRARKVWKVSHANIVDTSAVSGEYLEGRVLIERLCSPEVLDSINAILAKTPSLVEEWESIALSDILGRSLIIDGQYIPVESNRFKEALTLNNYMGA